MSWLSKVFSSLFGRKPPEPPEPPVQIAPQAPQPAPVGATPVLLQPKPPAPDPAPAAPTGGASPPATTRFGDWRDPLPGETADAYYARTGLAGYGKTGAELYAEDQARIARTEWGQLAITARFNGPIPVDQLTPEEGNFLLYVSRNYSSTNSDYIGAILAGSKNDVFRVMNEADRRAGHGGYDPNSYPATGRLRGYVDDVANGRLKPNVTH